MEKTPPPSPKRRGKARKKVISSRWLVPPERDENGLVEGDTSKRTFAACRCLPNVLNSTAPQSCKCIPKKKNLEPAAARNIEKETSLKAMPDAFRAADPSFTATNPSELNKGKTQVKGAFKSKQQTINPQDEPSEESDVEFLQETSQAGKMTKYIHIKQKPFSADLMKKKHLKNQIMDESAMVQGEGNVPQLKGRELLKRICMKVCKNPKEKDQYRNVAEIITEWRQLLGNIQNEHELEKLEDEMQEAGRKELDGTVERSKASDEAFLEHIDVDLKPGVDFDQEMKATPLKRSPRGRQMQKEGEERLFREKRKVWCESMCDRLVDQGELGSFSSSSEDEDIEEEVEPQLFARNPQKNPEKTQTPKGGKKEDEYVLKPDINWCKENCQNIVQFNKEPDQFGAVIRNLHNNRFRRLAKEEELASFSESSVDSSEAWIDEPMVSSQKPKATKIKKPVYKHWKNPDTGRIGAKNYAPSKYPTVREGTNLSSSGRDGKPSATLAEVQSERDDRDGYLMKICMNACSHYLKSYEADKTAKAKISKRKSGKGKKMKKKSEEDPRTADHEILVSSVPMSPDDQQMRKRPTSGGASQYYSTKPQEEEEEEETNENEEQEKMTRGRWRRNEAKRVCLDMCTNEENPENPEIRHKIYEQLRKGRFDDGYDHEGEFMKDAVRKVRARPKSRGPTPDTKKRMLKPLTTGSEYEYNDNSEAAAKKTAEEKRILREKKKEMWCEDACDLMVNQIFGDPDLVTDTSAGSLDKNVSETNQPKSGKGDKRGAALEKSGSQSRLGDKNGQPGRDRRRELTRDRSKTKLNQLADDTEPKFKSVKQNMNVLRTKLTRGNFSDPDISQQKTLHESSSSSKLLIAARIQRPADAKDSQAVDAQRSPTTLSSAEKRERENHREEFYETLEELEGRYAPKYLEYRANRRNKSAVCRCPRGFSVPMRTEHRRKKEKL